MTGKRTASPKPSTPDRAKRPTRKRRARTGILWLVALSLLTSAFLRLGSSGGFAIAQEVAGFSTEDVEAAQACTPDEDIATLLNLLNEREDRLKSREQAFEDRAQALEIAEEQVRKNLLALEQAEADLERMIALSSDAAEDDLSRLTSVYENMKPKQAALVFAEMPPEFAAGFLGRMRADAAATILAGLAPDKAYAISVLLAGRNATAPTE